MLEIPSGEEPDQEIAPAPNLIRVSTVSSRVSPAIPALASQVSLHLSRSGDNVIVTWPEADRLVYEESEGNDWSSQREIASAPTASPPSRAPWR